MFLQKHGDIVADISKVNTPNIDITFSEWKSKTQGGIPSRDVYKGAQWELIKELDSKILTYAKLRDEFNAKRNVYIP